MFCFLIFFGIALDIIFQYVESNGKDKEAGICWDSTGVYRDQGFQKWCSLRFLHESYQMLTAVYGSYTQ